jgi:hypothetical protein
MKFTPRTKQGTRLILDIVETEIPRGKPWTKIVTEEVTGKKWRARGKSCGLPSCFCDAIVEEV